MSLTTEKKMPFVYVFGVGFMDIFATVNFEKYFYVERKKKRLQD